MNKQLNKALKLAIRHSKSYGRKGTKGFGKRFAAKANRRASNALCGE